MPQTTETATQLHYVHMTKISIQAPRILAEIKIKACIINAYTIVMIILCYT